MNEAGADSSIWDDAYRTKIAKLRDGVLQVLCEHNIFLRQGVPNSVLLDALFQVMENCGKTVAYVENLNSDWRDEYLRIAKQIAVIIDDTKLDIETAEPEAILESIKQRQAA